MDQAADTRGHQLGAVRKQADVVIVPLDDDRRGLDRLDRNALFVVYLPETVFDDLEGNGVGHDPVPSSIAILPSESIVAVQPGGIQMVVVLRSTTAGPGSAVPEVSVRKSTILASVYPRSRR